MISNLEGGVTFGASNWLSFLARCSLVNALIVNLVIAGSDLASSCLCLYRYIALEDYDNGIRCFHSALQVNERHYNSWYGLGVVFLRQEKFEFAAHNFHRAYHINPRSSIIMSYLGMALHSLKVDIILLCCLQNNCDGLSSFPLKIHICYKSFCLYFCSWVIIFIAQPDREMMRHWC